jgi:hypothetical protein
MPDMTNQAVLRRRIETAAHGSLEMQHLHRRLREAPR